MSVMALLIMACFIPVWLGIVALAVLPLKPGLVLLLLGLLTTFLALRWLDHRLQ